jgi:hypothetical protein
MRCSQVRRSSTVIRLLPGALALLVAVTAGPGTPHLGTPARAASPHVPAHPIVAPRPVGGGGDPVPGRVFLPFLDGATAPRFSLRSQFGGQVGPAVVAGNRVYVTVGQHLLAIDVSDPAAPRVAGDLDLPQGEMSDIETHGDLLYLAAATRNADTGVTRFALTIVDFRHPVAPHRVALLSGEDYCYSLQIAVGSDHLYLSCQSFLRIFDVSRPAAPREVFGMDPDNYRIVDLFAAPPYLYATTYDYSDDFETNSVLRVFDIAAPASPIEIAHLPLDKLGWIVVDGSVAVIAGSPFRWENPSNELRFVDVSRPDAPAEVGSLHVEGLLDVAARDGTAFVIGDEGVLVVDYTVPSAPHRVGSVSRDALAAIPGGLYNADYYSDNAARVTGAGGYAYVTSVDGLVIVDARLAKDPSAVGGWPVPLKWPEAIDVAGDFVYVADCGRGLVVLRDAGDRLVHVGGASAANADDVWCGTDIRVAGGKAFIVGEEGLEIFDVTDPARPTVIAHVGAIGAARAVDVADHYAYVGGGRRDGYLRVVDVSDPARPVVRGEVILPPAAADLTSDVSDVRVRGHYAYAATGRSGLKVVDVADPDAPRLAGTFERDRRYIGHVAVDDRFVYFGDDTYLWLMDVSDPRSPFEIGRVGPRSASALDATDRYVFAYIGGALVAYDTTDPGWFQSVAAYESGYSGSDVRAVGRRVYGIGRDGGLYGLELARASGAR